MSDTPDGIPPGHPEDTQPVTIEVEMRRSYLDYAMSVIVARALPVNVTLDLVGRQVKADIDMIHETEQA